MLLALDQLGEEYNEQLSLLGGRIILGLQRAEGPDAGFAWAHWLAVSTGKHQPGSVPTPCQPPCRPPKRIPACRSRGCSLVLPHATRYPLPATRHPPPGCGVLYRPDLGMAVALPMR